MACESQEQCYLSMSCPWSSFLITEERSQDCCLMRVWIGERKGVNQTQPNYSTICEETKHPRTKGRGESLKPAYYLKLDHMLFVMWACVPVALSSTHATFLAQTGLKTDMYITKLQCHTAFTSSNKTELHCRLFTQSLNNVIKMFTMRQQDGCWFSASQKGLTTLMSFPPQSVWCWKSKRAASTAVAFQCFGKVLEVPCIYLETRPWL